MPKKAKKGKKGKKGKKSGKKGSKKDPSIKAMSEANSKMWETRLEVVEKSRHEYRDNARRLLTENEALNQQMQQTEKDTIDVVTYLKRQDQDKDKQIDKMMNQMKETKKDHRKEMEKVVDDFQQQMSELEQQLAARTHEAEIMQTELKQVKEFQRKRAQMQKELEEIKEAMFAANKEHKETLQRMEQKFFEEKMRLQQEANQKIAELADRAHTEAIANLDDATRSVYKENVRVNEALSYHMEEGEKLKRLRSDMEKENADLQGEKEMHEMLIQEKVQQAKLQKQAIKELQDKVETLEASLSHVVREFEKERKSLVQKARVENETSKIEIAKLQRVVDLKTREMNKVKKLAKNILDQRTEMERFFLEALEHVKLEINANRMQYRKDAQLAYQRRMLAAHTGQGEFPKIRTFTKSDNSTNSVFKDLEAAEKLPNGALDYLLEWHGKHHCNTKKQKKKKRAEVSGKVDISELTWEQKERVLRFLFAKLNGAQQPARGASSQTALEPYQPTTEEETGADMAGGGDDDNTFLTNAQVDDGGSIPNLPSIHQSQTNLITAEPVS